MRIALCDDNDLFLQEMQERLKAIPTVEHVYVFGVLEEFLHSVRAGDSYDAVLMDLDWNGEHNGIYAAEELYRLSPETKVIYVTGYISQFVQQIFLHKANLSGFLSKPVDTELLRENLAKVKEGITHQKNEMLVVRANGAVINIPIEDICFIESEKHIVRIHTAKESIVVYEKLSNFLDRLPECFCQCHKSYLVNMRQIRRFQGSNILLKKGDVIPVSRSRNVETREQFFAFVGQEI